jgi:hypothetical protein
LRAGCFASPLAGATHVDVRYVGPVRLAMLCLLVACDSDEHARRPRVGNKLPATEQVTTSSSSTTNDPPPPVTVNELVEGGRHLRLATAHGPVHVWTPKGYEPRRAETIIYVHGYYVHVDDAWRDYKLESQFASSAINAIFIAPEGPASPVEAVSWDALAPLLDAVEQGMGQPLPRRRIVTIGHSAAYRTLLGWLDEVMIDTVVLVDAAYGEIDEYKKWVLADDKHRLIDIGDDTRAWTDKLHADLPETVVLEEFPSLEDGIPREASRARILYIKSSLGHFPLVTNGFALPMVLRTLRAKRLLREPLAELLAR